jgi:hypothetical protein
VKDESSKHSACKTRTNRQVTADYAGDAGNHPEHDKLCRPVKFFNKRPEYQQAEHVHEQVKNIDVHEHRRDEAPPLVIRRIDEVVQLGPIRGQHRIGKTSLQRGNRHPARFPHQEKDEDVCYEQRDCEFVRTIKDRACESYCFLVGWWILARICG